MLGRYPKRTMKARSLQKKHGKGKHRLIDYAASLEKQIDTLLDYLEPPHLDSEQRQWLQADPARWAFWLEVTRNLDNSQVDLASITAYTFFNRNQRKYLADGLKARKIATLSRQGDGGTLTLWGHDD